MGYYFRRGYSQIKYLPSVAGSSPTRAEIAAGIDLSGPLSGIAGFKLNNAPIAAPSLATSFDAQVDGPDTTAASSLTFNDDNASSTVRTTLAKGTNGYIVLFPYKDLVGKRCEVWPVRSTGVNDDWSMGANVAAFDVGFAVTALPTQNATVPA